MINVHLKAYHAKYDLPEDRAPAAANPSLAGPWPRRRAIRTVARPAPRRPAERREPRCLERIVAVAAAAAGCTKMVLIYPQTATTLMQRVCIREYGMYGGR